MSVWGTGSRRAIPAPESILPKTARPLRSGQIPNAIPLGVIRARPILLTTLAVMLGSAIMLTDPVFGGLAISLIFGTVVSSALTIIIVPVLYYRAERGNTDQIDRSGTFASLPEAKS